MLQNKASDIENDLEVKSFDLVRDSDPEIAYGLWDSETKAFIDAQTLNSLFYSEDWVFICCDLVASTVSSVPLRIMKKSVQDGKEIFEPNALHSLQKLVDAPNPNQDEYSFKYSLAQQDVLMGNAVIWYAAKAKQLNVLPAHTIRLDFDESGKLKTYIATEANYMGAVNNDGKNIYKFAPDEILHVRRPNPGSVMWGLSPFVPGRKSVLFNRYSQDYLNAYYLKGATPGLALKVDKAVNEQAALRLLKSFEVNYTGRRNQRRTLVLPAGVEVEQISNTIADQQLTMLIEQNQDKILNILRIPKHALSLAKSGSLGSEEHKMALKFMWEGTIIPMLKRIQGTFNRFFADELGDNHEFQFDISGVNLLKDDELKKAALAREMLSVKTINEIRAELYNLPPLDGGDSLPGQVAAPFGMQSVPEMAESEEQEEPQQPVEEQIATNGPVAIGTVQEEQESKELQHYKARYKEWLDKSMKSQNDSIESKGKRMNETAVNLYVEMYKLTIEELKQSFKNLKAKDDEFKPGGLPKKPAKNVSLYELEKRINRAFVKLKKKWKKDYTDELSETVELGYKTQLELIFNQEARDAIEAIGSETASGRRRILEARGLKSFSHISQSTTKDIIDVVQKGMEENQTLAQVGEKLAEKFKGILSESRANTIARTETLTAVSIGQAAMMEDAKEVIPGLMKVWINMGDDNVRDSHRGKINGQTVPVDKPFTTSKNTKLRYPRDTDVDDASEVINCRCTMLLVPPEDLNDLDIPKQD